MALITATELREHVDTDLGDTALGRLLDDADDEITRRYGAHTGSQVETFRPTPHSVLLHTDRSISAVTSITETFPAEIGETTNTLTSGDYGVEGNRTLRRKATGSYSASCWAPLVVVTYTPVADSDRRARVTIDLVRLSVQYQAVQSHGLGDASVSYSDYARERELLLRVLAPSMLGLFA